MINKHDLGKEIITPSVPKMVAHVPNFGKIKVHWPLTE